MRNYIATQGPKSETLEKFWEMIWIYDSPVIVMLCNCVEKGKVDYRLMFYKDLY